MAFKNSFATFCLLPWKFEDTEVKLEDTEVKFEDTWILLADAQTDFGLHCPPMPEDSFRMAWSKWL